MTPDTRPPTPSPLDARGLPIGYPFKPDWEVPPREIRDRLAARATDPKSEFILLDCREPDEHQVARIPGAVLIPMGQTERRSDELESADGSRATPIVVMCHHGRRSLRVAATLRALGFSDVRSMAGGIDLWSLDVDPATPRY